MSLPIVKICGITNREDAVGVFVNELRERVSDLARRLALAALSAA